MFFSILGAVFLQHLVRKFDELGHLEDYGIGKEIDNVIVLLCHLYNFKVIITFSLKKYIKTCVKRPF